MSFEKAGGGPGEGIFPSLRRVRVHFDVSDGDIPRGTHVMFDLADADSITDFTYGLGGDPGSDAINTVRLPDAVASNVNSLSAYFFGLAEEDIDVSVDPVGWLHVRGKFSGALVAASTAKGDTMIPATSGTLARSGTAGGNQKIIAIATTGISGGASDVLFNGIEGFGNN